MNCFIIVPVYNEGKVFQEWLPGLLKVAGEMGAKVVVVDDGSDPAIFNFQFSIFNEGIVLLRHEVNCGVGAAIATGMAYAKRNGAEKVLTIDGDGQHDPNDLRELIRVLEDGEVDVVNGSRFLKKQWIPWSRRVANFLGNIITYLLSGFWVSDSQSGMKGFSKKALEKIEVRTAGYEWCTDIFREANWYDFQLQEVPISVLYNKYSLNKGQNLAIGIDMVVRLAIRSLWR
ncbi:MAG: glycosyltransferase family 2 protein [Candidatus Altimarinota bacterium]